MSLLPVETGQIVTVATFFRVARLLGTGRYSEVYEAFDVQSQSDIALKVYAGTDAETHKLAGAEAELLSRLGELNCEYFPRMKNAVKHRLQNRYHPVLALELGAYYRPEGNRDVIKLADIIPVSQGEPTAANLVEGFWESEAVIGWLVHLFQAVQLLRTAGIVHRDIKPSNIVIKRTANGSETLPFLLDFNSSPTATSSDRGTPRYLPPEVRARERSEPSDADDVWAAALVAWEMLHGSGAEPGSNAPTGEWVGGANLDGVISALDEALCLDREKRLVDPAVIVRRLERSREARSHVSQAPPVGAGEFAAGQSVSIPLRLAMEEALAPAHILVIPKEVEDGVHTLLMWLNEDETQALDLVSELVRLGPRALPACLGQGHKLSPQSPALDDIVEALTAIGRQELSLAARAVELYATSSNISVRLLSRRLCDTLELFPDSLLGALFEDPQILLPSERTELALLCIQHSESDKATSAVLYYLCREYLEDQGRYHQLRNIALAMGQLQHPKTPQFVVLFARKQRWEKLSEYGALPASERRSIVNGLLELLADAFSSMGDGASDLIRSNKVASRTEGDPPFSLFARFARQLARRHEHTREWLLAEAQRHPEDTDLERAVERLKSQTESEPLDLDVLLSDYLRKADRQSFNTLRFCNDSRVFSLIGERLQDSGSDTEVKSLANLLKGFESRQRGQVVQCALASWRVLHDAVTDLAIDVISRYPIANEGQKRQAISLLNELLGGPQDEKARRGLDRLLGE